MAITFSGPGPLPWRVGAAFEGTGATQAAKKDVGGKYIERVVRGRSFAVPWQRCERSLRESASGSLRGALVCRRRRNSPRIAQASHTAICNVAGLIGLQQHNTLERPAAALANTGAEGAHPLVLRGNSQAKGQRGDRWFRYPLRVQELLVP